MNRAISRHRSRIHQPDLRRTIATAAAARLQVELQRIHAPQNKTYQWSCRQQGLTTADQSPLLLPGGPTEENEAAKMLHATTNRMVALGSEISSYAKECYYSMGFSLTSAPMTISRYQFTWHNRLRLLRTLSMPERANTAWSPFDR